MELYPDEVLVIRGQSVEFISFGGEERVCGRVPDHGHDTEDACALAQVGEHLVVRGLRRQLRFFSLILQTTEWSVLSQSASSLGQK